MGGFCSSLGYKASNALNYDPDGENGAKGRITPGTPTPPASAVLRKNLHVLVQYVLCHLAPHKSRKEILKNKGKNH